MSERAKKLFPIPTPVKRCPACETQFEGTLVVCKKDGTLLIPLAQCLTDERLRKILTERWQLDDWIVQCSDAVVVRAHQAGELRAIKVFNVNDSDPARGRKRQRFVRGAQTLEQLSHHNIVQLHEIGEATGEKPYMILEYVKDGLSLGQIDLKELPLRYFVDIFSQACDGLGYAHQHGVFHNDLSFNDILIAEAPHDRICVKITDFAKGSPLLHSDNRLQQLTEVGDLFGHPEFMSPEMAHGKPLDARSNIYSLGSIMYTCLAGGEPFMGPHWGAILLKKLMEEIPPLPELKVEPQLSGAVRSIVTKCLEMAPAKRYRNAAALKQALQKIDCDRCESVRYSVLRAQLEQRAKQPGKKI